MTAVDDDRNLGDVRCLVRVRQDVAKRHAFLVCGCVGGHEVPPELVLRAMTGEVQERDLSGIGEEVFEAFPQPRAGHVLEIGGEKLCVKINAAVVVPAQEPLYGVGIIDTPRQRRRRIIVDTDN